jgi:20S proteasome alpha/beta subunit
MHTPANSVSLALLICLVYLFVPVSMTTVVAARCKDGIVMCVDSLSANNGPLIATRSSKKAYMLTDATVICCVNSGGLGSTHFQQLYSELRDTVSEYRSRFEIQLPTSSIIKVARRLVAAQYNEAHIVIAGYDRTKPISKVYSTGDEVNYMLSEILPGGAKIDQLVVAAGTGSTIISSLLEESLRTSKPHPLLANHGTKESRDGAAAMTPVGDGVNDDCLSKDGNLNSLSVEETAAVLRKCLRQASKLDPQTGGDRYTMWVLSSDRRTARV